MWPDWAIFESLLGTKFLAKVAELPIVDTFGQLLEKIGLLFTPTSGHTVSKGTVVGVVLVNAMT